MNIKEVLKKWWGVIALAGATVIGGIVAILLGSNTYKNKTDVIIKKDEDKETDAKKVIAEKEKKEKEIIAQNKIEVTKELEKTKSVVKDNETQIKTNEQIIADNLKLLEELKKELK